VGSPSIRPDRLALLISLATVACHHRAEDLRPFEVAYWLWPVPGDRYAPAVRGQPVDRLYVQVGQLAASPTAQARWPSGLPPARACVAVWRSDQAAPPDPAAIDALVRQYGRLREEAARAGRPVRGLQLDVDCPTARLADYAAFLRQLRRRLPDGDELSITALLDWFRPRTGVAAVVAETDEYVPQFYDTAPSGAELRVAEPVDARWGETFEALGRPYRLGLASFGRILRTRTVSPGEVERVAFRDLAPLDLPRGLEPLGWTRSAAGEVVARWRATAQARHPELPPDSRLEMVLPSPESVRAGVEAARSWKGRCAGVVFFRWPAEGEALVLSPAEVGAALAPARPPAPSRLIATDGACRPRRCTDLSVSVEDRFAAAPLRLRLAASAEVDYMLAARPDSLTASGSRRLVAAVPAYPGIDVVPLGRVFTRQPARFWLED
jgi:uncharacterized protein DUF3142